MFDQTFKAVDDELRKGAGCSTDPRFIEQAGRMKYLYKLEEGCRTEALLADPMNIIQEAVHELATLISTLYRHLLGARSSLIEAA
jgi:hypothetical protein